MARSNSEYFGFNTELPSPKRLPVATAEFSEWFGGLARSDKLAVINAVDRLDEVGPANLSRPYAADIKGALKGLRELRTNQGLRIMFKADPDGIPVLLNGMDKGEVARGRETTRLYGETIEQAGELWANYEREVLGVNGARDGLDVADPTSLGRNQIGRGSYSSDRGTL